MATHLNSGFNVKNLYHTANCPHKLIAGSWFEHVDTKATLCMTNGCTTVLTATQKRGCHVIAANQNDTSGKRFIVALCATCNADYEHVLNIRLNAKECYLPHCDCGHLAPVGDARSCKQCKANLPATKAAKEAAHK